MPRFVILEHRPGRGSRAGLHWDLMLERGETLRTWALETPPAPGGAISATALADHRREYLSYEGPLSGERGAVARWDAGDYELVAESPSEVRLVLKGTKFAGQIVGRRARPDGDRWQFEFDRTDGSSPDHGPIERS